MASAKGLRVTPRTTANATLTLDFDPDKTLSANL